MFIVVLSAVLALMNVYLWKRLVKDTTGPGRTRRILTAVLIALALLLVATLVVPRFFDVPKSGWYAWPGYLWFGLLAYLFLTLLVLEPVRLALRRWIEGQPQEASATAESARPALNRRMFIARTSAVAAGAASVGLVGIGAATALGPPDLLQVPVRLRRLDPALRGFRIAVVSDIHLGPLAGRAHTEQIVRRHQCRGAGPRGDRGRSGGRHRRGTRRGGRTVAGPVRTRGHVLRHRQPRVLRRRHRRVADANSSGSASSRCATRTRRSGAAARRSISSASTTSPASSATTRPTSTAPWRESTRRVRRSCSHTNRSWSPRPPRAGWICSCPATPTAGRCGRFTTSSGWCSQSIAGLSTVDDTQLYVTRGAGFWGPPVRIGAPPDVTVLSLEP